MCFLNYNWHRCFRINPFTKMTKSTENNTVNGLTLNSLKIEEAGASNNNINSPLKITSHNCSWVLLVD